MEHTAAGSRGRTGRRNITVIGIFLGQQECSMQVQTHQAVASATPANVARNKGKAATNSDGIIVQTTISGFDCRNKITEAFFGGKYGIFSRSPREVAGRNECLELMKVFDEREEVQGGLETMKDGRK